MDQVKRDAARTRTVKSYRRKKNLCEDCGKFEEGEEHLCVPCYDKSDMRDPVDKAKEPKIVKTPKKKPETIKQEILVDEINAEFIRTSKDPFIRINKTADFHASRPHIIIDLNRSENNQKVDFSYLNYMARKYDKHIIYTIGDLDALYVVHDKQKMTKLMNVRNIGDINDQMIVNMIFTCDRLYGFPSRYVAYCMSRDLPCTTFMEKQENLPCDIVQINAKKDLDIEVVKQNILASKL